MKDNDSFVCYPTEQMGYVPGGIDSLTRRLKSKVSSSVVTVEYH